MPLVSLVSNGSTSVNGEGKRRLLQVSTVNNGVNTRGESLLKNLRIQNGAMQQEEIWTKLNLQIALLSSLQLCCFALLACHSHGASVDRNLLGMGLPSKFHIQAPHKVESIPQPKPALAMPTQHMEARHTILSEVSESSFNAAVLANVDIAGQANLFLVTLDTGKMYYNMSMCKLQQYFS